MIFFLSRPDQEEREEVCLAFVILMRYLTAGGFMEIGEFAQALKDAAKTGCTAEQKDSSIIVTREFYEALSEAAVMLFQKTGHNDWCRIYDDRACDCHLGTLKARIESLL
jgi:hypothetical protein